MKKVKIIVEWFLIFLCFIGIYQGLWAQENGSNSVIRERLRVYYVSNPNTATNMHSVAVSNTAPIFGSNPNMEAAQQLVRAIFYGGETHTAFQGRVTAIVRGFRRPAALILYDDTAALNENVSATWANCIRNRHFFICGTEEDDDDYQRIVHLGAYQMNQLGIEAIKTRFLRVLSGASGNTGWWDTVDEDDVSREDFEVCTPFANDYEEFREAVVSNSPELRRGMIYRSNNLHAGQVIDRRPDLRHIHRGYLNAGTRAGQRVCLSGHIARDGRGYVALIRFSTPDVHTFEDEPVVGDSSPVQERELNRLRGSFNTFTDETIAEVPTIFGRPDSHDVSLASAISVYCNNLIRLSRGDRTMIPAEVSRDFARPIRDRAQRDWNNLTANDSSPALRGQDRAVINNCQSWARAVLLEHGNTTDPTTINNFVQSFNGYRNY